jgi:hypothetical protein
MTEFLLNRTCNIDIPNAQKLKDDDSERLAETTGENLWVPRSERRE